MSSRYKKPHQTAQQIKEEQINFLLGDVEKNLEEYKRTLELKEKQLLDAKKIFVSAKQNYDKRVAENKELKAYIENIKQHFQSYQQQQQAQFLEQQRNHYQKKNQKKYKKVVYEDETESEPELEEEVDEFEEEVDKENNRGKSK